MFAWGSALGFAVVASVLAASATAATRWAHIGYRWAVAGAATSAGFAARNGLLNVTHARGFSADAPVTGFSWADAALNLIVL